MNMYLIIFEDASRIVVEAKSAQDAVDSIVKYDGIQMRVYLLIDMKGEWK